MAVLSAWPGDERRAELDNGSFDSVIWFTTTMTAETEHYIDLLSLFITIRCVMAFDKSVLYPT